MMEKHDILGKIAFFLLLFSALLHAGSLQAQEEDFVRSTSDLPVARAFHGSAVLGDFLYCFGGSVLTPDGRQVPTPLVNVARIAPDGLLSQFADTTPLPEPRHYIENSSIVLNDTLYILGGSDAVLGGERANTILWNRVMPNGALGPWRRSVPFEGMGVSCVAGFSTAGFLHLTGGTGTKEDQVTRSCWSVRINPDGSPGQWERAPELPAPLWFHCGVVVAGRAYVWGGLNIDKPSYTQASDKIYSAPILGSGRLGQWIEEPLRMPQGYYAASCTVAGPYVFAMCPRYEGGRSSNDIWWTTVTPQGMQPWQRRTTDLSNKLYRATATDYRRGMIYVTGGKTGGKVATAQPATYRIKLSEKARRLAEQVWIASQGQGAAQGSISSTEYAEAQLRAGGTSQLSYDPPTANMTGQTGFLGLEQARSASLQNRKPMIMYFNIKAATPCQEQDRLIASESFQNLQKQAVFASIEANLYPQIAQQYGVYRVPAWVLFDSQGEKREFLVGVQSAEALAPKVAALP